MLLNVRVQETLTPNRAEEACILLCAHVSLSVRTIECVRTSVSKGVITSQGSESKICPGKRYKNM